MAFGGWGEGKIGVTLDLANVDGGSSEADKNHAGEKASAKNRTPAPLRADAKLFSETGGFICEIPASKEKQFTALCKKNGLAEPICFGATTAASKLVFKNGSKKLIELDLKTASERWLNGLREKM
jgi:hypothetical protein